MRPVVLLTAAVGMALGCRDVGEVLTPSDGSPDDGAAGAGQVPAGLMASDLSAGNAHACAVGGVIPCRARLATRAPMPSCGALAAMRR